MLGWSFSDHFLSAQNLRKKNVVLDENEFRVFSFRIMNELNII